MGNSILDEFKDYYRELKNYEEAAELISWELHTEASERAVEHLVDLQSFYGGKAFEMSTSDKMGEYLDKLSVREEYDSLPKEWQLSVDRLKEEYDENKNIPVDFYTEYMKTVAKAEDVWQNAKRDNDYESFKPYLEKIVDSIKKMCNYRKPDKNPYDLLLNDFEKGMEREQIDKVFNELKEELIPLVKKITEKKQPDKSRFMGDFDINKQKELSEFLLNYIGFDMKAGIMAESEHPFTTGLNSNDVRLTNHYYRENIINPVFSIIHEGGHGIFMQNVDGKYMDTPLSDCHYMGLHESQSRFMENILGRNINFWKPIYYKLKELFPQYENIPIEDFYREINHVENSLIRIDADEVTYCFHIIVRYEIERDLFDGKIDISDIPEAWNNKMKEYLGVEPPDMSSGLLQDSHWSGGAFGYFPSYLLGSIYDGMLLERIEKELGDIDKILSEGRVKEITKWLNTHIHKNGTAVVPKELIEELCGKEITAKPLINYFKKKYSSLYEL